MEPIKASTGTITLIIASHTLDTVTRSTDNPYAQTMPTDKPHAQTMPESIPSLRPL